MSESKTIPDENFPEWKKEFRRIVDCGYDEDSSHDLVRFTFRVSRETYQRWKEIAYD